MRITLDNGPFWTFLLRSDTGETRLVQHDGDFPGVARTFGWAGRGEDDDCDVIWHAYEFLERIVGESVEDPGYF